jgi:hypothetical protein
MPSARHEKSSCVFRANMLGFARDLGWKIEIVRVERLQAPA